MDLGVEDRDALAVGRQDVGVAVLEPDDEAFEAQAAQVVAGLGLAVGDAEQRADLGSQGAVGEAGDSRATVARNPGGTVRQTAGGRASGYRSSPRWWRS